MGRRIEPRQHGVFLVNAVDAPARVEGLVPRVGALRVAAGALGGGPVPDRDHDVALEPRRPRRGLGIGAGRDGVGPAAEHPGLFAEPPEHAGHHAAAEQLAVQALQPCFVGGEILEVRGYLPGPLVAEGVALQARLDGRRDLQGRDVAVGNLEQAEPRGGGIDGGGGPGVGGHRRREVETLPADRRRPARSRAGRSRARRPRSRPRAGPGPRTAPRHRSPRCARTGWAGRGSRRSPRPRPPVPARSRPRPRCRPRRARRRPAPAHASPPRRPSAPPNRMPHTLQRASFRHLRACTRAGRAARAARPANCPRLWSCRRCGTATARPPPRAPRRGRRRGCPAWRSCPRGRRTRRSGPACRRAAAPPSTAASTCPGRSG